MSIKLLKMLPSGALIAAISVVSTEKILSNVSAYGTN